MAESDALFWIRFWGVRGTVPTPGPSTVRYGGNTACIEVGCGSARLIFDLGTGARELGNTLLDNGPCDAHVFLTHTHLDHVGGFPFFRPAYCETNRFQIWAGHLQAQALTLKSTLKSLMSKPLFPVPIDVMHARIDFHDFRAGERLSPAGGVDITTAPLRHPGGATAYRVDFAGRSFALVTDTEHTPGKPDKTVLQLIAGCDLVIYDSTYDDATFERFLGWGHSTWQEGVRLCRQAGAKRLAAFHHDPESDDERLAQVEAALGAALPGSLVAVEGMVLEP